MPNTRLVPIGKRPGPNIRIMPRGKRPPRVAAVNPAAINNAILGTKRNVGLALGAAAAALPVPSSAPMPGPSRTPTLGKPCPSGGIGVKNMDRYRRRNKHIKIKKSIAPTEDCER